MSQEGFKELLKTQNAREKVSPILNKLLLPIKTALISEDDVVFEAGLNALMQLSDTIGEDVNAHLKIFLSAVRISLYNFIFEKTRCQYNFFNTIGPIQIMHNMFCMR